MIEEGWRPVIGYEGRYEVSNYGRVRSLLASPARILKPTGPYPGQPYPRFQLSKDGKCRGHDVHILVLRAFVGVSPKGAVTRHLDGDRTNNHLDNLIYGTPAENTADMMRHGTAKNPYADKMAAQTHCKNNHEYTEETTYYSTARGRWITRVCRICRRARSKKFRELHPK